MTDTSTRLSELFVALFPGVNSQTVRSARSESLDEWDSIAMVTLVTLIQEEFGLVFDYADAGQWTSFQDVENALKSRLNES